jgi:ABC transport system ATP-binding/permease protein
MLERAAHHTQRVNACLFGVAPGRGCRVSPCRVDRITDHAPRCNRGGVIAHPRVRLVSVVLFLNARMHWTAVNRYPALWSPDLPRYLSVARLPSLPRVTIVDARTCDNVGYWWLPSGNPFFIVWRSLMAATPLLTLQNVQLAFGHHALLDHANLTIAPQERIGLIGRNGAGKSSLLKLLDQRSQPDDGLVVNADSLRVATVEQEPTLEALTVLEVLSAEAGRPDAEDWEREILARKWADKVGILPETLIDTLSGGMRKRVALAAALVREPDLLLLDEPTNHLDLDGILWLQKLLLEWRGSVLLITHDRRFLDDVVTRIVELDRGKLLSFPGNFAQWQFQKEAFLHAEQLENARFDKLLAQEEVWIRKGVEARRTRNEGRVRRLEQLRRDRAQRRDQLGRVSLKVDHSSRSGKLVAELKDVNKGYDDKIVLQNFSTTILRGDKIGVIGPNGAGKSTLLQLILGKLEADSGEIKLGTNLQVAYFDQMREQLDETAALVDVINPGSEWVEIGQEKKHVMSYLGDFLFAPARAQSPVSSLSGGERARLLLARLFARPANILVLDEPTNDLDIETLELLEVLLQDFSGTVLLVSHDRAFLDNVVTQTIAYEGHGHWGTYVGGYEDWLSQRPKKSTSQSPDKNASDISPAGKPTAAAPKRKSARLSSWEEKELATLPEKIQLLEAQQSALVTKLASPELYQGDGETLGQVQADVDGLDGQLRALYERWEALDAKKA